MDRGLKGKVAVITGGSAGIGLGVARAFAAEGARVLVADEHAPIKRFGTVEELADFFVFLCSERASYSVGSTCHVDGGMLRTI